jgi:hypothetical protein
MTLGRIGKPVVESGHSQCGPVAFARGCQMAANSYHSLRQAAGADRLRGPLMQVSLRIALAASMPPRGAASGVAC